MLTALKTYLTEEWRDRDMKRWASWVMLIEEQSWMCYYKSGWVKGDFAFFQSLGSG